MISKIIHGDCIDKIKKLDDNSIDAIVTDPPYGLGFMNKEWDKFTSKEYQDFCYKWGIETLRVLKKGGYLLAFSGTRTYHRLVCGLEDAGFIIKDMINWVYGSGFPKSLDISKAIDKYYGIEIPKGKLTSENIAMGGGNYTRTGSIRKITGIKLRHGGGLDEKYMGMTQDKEIIITEPATKKAKEWEDWGTGLKPAHEPIVLAQKPYEGTYAENVLKWGVGGLNIGGCRIKYLDAGEDPRVYDKNKNIIRVARKASPHTVSFPPMSMPYAKEGGRWPSNVVLTHHPECKLIGTKKVGPNDKRKQKLAGIKKSNIFPLLPVDSSNYGKEILDNYDCHPECPISMVDEQSGDQPTSFRPNLIGNNYRSKSMFGHGGLISRENSFPDRGGASRFFYCGKAYKTERNAGLDAIIDTPNTEMVNRKEKSAGIENPRAGAGRGSGAKNTIATLKPINLMRYLIRLVTPIGGTVLDPFAGSGTTGIACIIEGFKYILIEKRKRFATVIIPKRLEYWKNPKNWELLKEHPLLPKIDTKIKQKQNKNINDFL